MRKHLSLLLFTITLSALILISISAQKSDTIIKLDTEPAQDQLLRAADYIKNRYDERVGLVTESEDTGTEFFGTVPHNRTFWVYSDNLWASRALEPYYPEIAQNISKTSGSYLDVVGYPAFFEVVLGKKISMPLRAGVNISMKNITLNGLDYTIMADRHQTEDGDSFYDADQYADLALYISLNYYLDHETAASERWFRVAESMWHDRGFKDKAVSASYQNYKLGLYLYTAKVTGFPSDILSDVENMAWSCQIENGGIATQTHLDGTINSTANVETTSILLLAYNKPLIRSFPHLEIGAYYYIWWGLPSPFPDHWTNSKGTPLLGKYNSSDPTVADEHVLLAKQHKIDFFAISWLGVFDWYDHITIDENLRKGLLQAKHIDEFSFCLLYESEIILKSIYDNCSQTPGLDPAELFKSVFIEDITYANTTYFNNPSYLRIEGKPVLFIYNLPYIYENLTSNSENSTRIMHELLDTVKARFEDNIYLVGEVGGEPDPAKTQENHTYSMDSVTNYLFSGAQDGWMNVLGNATRYYPEWNTAMTTKGIKYIPSAYPGYNNTGNEDSPNPTALPPDETKFEEFLYIAKENVDTDLNIIMLTSWNEWKDATMLEPSSESAETFLHVVHDIIPEFPSVLALTLFFNVAGVALLVSRRRQRRPIFRR